MAASFAKLSSGYRINSAADDAAGLAISENMSSQIRSYAVAERNANDAISMAQTAEGSLGEIVGILGRMRELAMQSSNASLLSADRTYLHTEFTSLQSEISRIQDSSKFNNQSIIASSATTNFKFQVGLGSLSSDSITVGFNGISISAKNSSITLTDQSSALSALASIDSSLSTISLARASFGASMNRFGAAASNIQTMRINLSAARSRIRDVDVAEETANLSKQQVLMQAGSSVLAQANSFPQNALSLLR